MLDLRNYYDSMCMVVFQLSELSTQAPSKAEIWNFFSNSIIPVIRKWQLDEPNQTSSGTAESEDGTALAVKRTNNWLRKFVADAKEMTQVEVCACNFNIILMPSS